MFFRRQVVKLVAVELLSGCMLFTAAVIHSSFQGPVSVDKGRSAGLRWGTPILEPSSGPVPRWGGGMLDRSCPWSW